MTGNEEVVRQADNREKEREIETDKERERTKSLLVINSFFVENFTSEHSRHHRSADGRKRARCSHVHAAKSHGAKSHSLIKGL